MGIQGKLGGIGLAQAIAAHAFGVRPDDLTSRSRRSEAIVRARHLAMYLSHVVLKCRQTQVARAFGRDHRLVPYACRRIEREREEPSFDQTVAWLETLLRRSVETPL